MSWTFHGAETVPVHAVQKGALEQYPAAICQASKNQVPSKKAKDVICRHTYTYIYVYEYVGYVYDRMLTPGRVKNPCTNACSMAAIHSPLAAMFQTSTLLSC